MVGVAAVNVTSVAKIEMEMQGATSQTSMVEHAIRSQSRPHHIEVIVMPYPDPNALEYLLEQERLFNEKRAELLERYRGRFVAFEDGRVLAVGDTFSEVAQRMLKERGGKPTLIKQVLPTDPTYSIPTPIHIGQ